LISKPELLEEYRRKAGAILEAKFAPEILIPKLEHLYAQIKEDLEIDPFPHRRATVSSDRSYNDIVASMEEFIRQRYELAREQLREPGARPEPARLAGNDNGPKPGPSSADAPSDLKAVRVTSTMVELRWVDHAEGEVAYVVQKRLGNGPGEFVNAIGQGGENIVSASDRDVQAGRTYEYRVYAVLPTAEGPRGTGVSNVIRVTIPEK
jgi:hypothetical protein